MRWTRNPVYPFPGIGGLNPSSSARDELAGMTIKVVGVCKFFFYGKVIKVKLAGIYQKSMEVRLLPVNVVAGLFFVVPMSDGSW